MVKNNLIIKSKLSMAFEVTTFLDEIRFKNESTRLIYSLHSIFAKKCELIILKKISLPGLGK